VPVLCIGILLLYVQNQQSEIINGEIDLINQEHKGLITVGKSNLSLFGNFPDLSIKIYDVKVFETKAVNAPLIMDVKDIYVGFNFWDIVSGNYDIHSVLISLFMKIIPLIFKIL